MALIQCPQCGSSVSDKADRCINCGYDFAANQQPEPIETHPLACRECGAPIEDTSSGVCPKCGCPIELTESEVREKEAAEAKKAADEAQAKKKKKIMAIVGGVAAIAIVALIVVASLQSSSTKSFNDYVDAYNSALTHMTSGGAAAESLIAKVSRVWRSAIFEDKRSDWDNDISEYYSDDFNTALSKLYADASVQATVNNITENQEIVRNDMQALQGAPEEFDKVEQTIDELYDTYLKFTKMAVSPTGSYETFTSETSTLDSDFVAQLDKAMSQIPEKK